VIEKYNFVSNMLPNINPISLPENALTES